MLIDPQEGFEFQPMDPQDGFDCKVFGWPLLGSDLANGNRWSKKYVCCDRFA
jgi:hypothetical protein